MHAKFSMFAVVVVTITGLMTTSEAACASNCNGHGTCGAWDRCSCYGSYNDPTAEDCSHRVCPFGKSSGKIATDNHGYSECSDNGICNRKSGLCECNDGFTGKACQRNECPSDCNGHGQCQTIETFDSSYSTVWDHDQTQVCQCDPGYEGAACERRKCPLGDDPLTLREIGGSNYQVDEVQTITITQAATNFVTSYFTLKFTDWTGQVHETRPLNIITLTSMEVEEALQAFPNNVIPSVSVTVTGPGTPANDVVIAVTFDSVDNAGTQTLLAVDISDKSAAGSQPIKAALANDVGPVAASDVAVVRSTTGSLESKVCAGRGICDTELGTCSCFTGFYGHACAFQTALQ